MPDKGTIQSREPFDITDLMTKMSDTIDTVTDTIVDLKGEIDTVLATIADTAATAQALINDVGDDARRSWRPSSKVSARPAGDRGRLEGRTRYGRQAADRRCAVSEREEAGGGGEQTMVERARGERAGEGVRWPTCRAKSGPVKGVTANLQQTLTSARDVMADMAETTEALKHNFLVRGFFNQRGYFDLADVSVEDYRKGVLENKERRALRLWIKAELLFERDEKGAERLSRGARSSRFGHVTVREVPTDEPASSWKATRRQPTAD